MLRIGCVKYLNARPLIRGWPGEVEYDHPSTLCQRLANGELDVALVSSFEFLRNPIYRIVDDVSIASDGPVYSVVVSYRGEFSNIEEIALDPASETSVNLLRCLLAERRLTPRLSRNTGFQSATGRTRRGEPMGSAGLQPAVSGAVQPTESKAAENISAGRTDSPRRIRPVTDNMPMFQAAHQAQLLIGDQAIQFRQKHAGEFQFWDLGEQWKNLTGLPFVYALWLIRPEVPKAKSIAHHLREIRNENLANLDDFIAETVSRVGASTVASAKADEPGNPRMTRKFVAHYYSEYLRFSFGEKEKRGLQAFARSCAKHQLLPNRDCVFSVV